MGRQTHTKGWRTEEQADGLFRLLKAVGIATEEPTFAEKRTILRQLDVRALQFETFGFQPILRRREGHDQRSL